MTRLSEKVDELVSTVRLVMRAYEEKIAALENEVRDQRLMAETARETVRQWREQAQKTRGNVQKEEGTGPDMHQREPCVSHTNRLSQLAQTPKTKECCVCGRDGWVNYLHLCAHCAKLTKWLRQKEKGNE